MNIRYIRSLAALATMTSGGLAHAHPGHVDHALAGLAHPFAGLDHLLAMVAVGVWACQQEGRAKWLVPTSFLGIMAIAAMLGMGGMALPMVESGIATSLLLLGLLISFSIRMSAVAGAAIVALFAVFHGYAHGIEMPAVAKPELYAAGFVAATAVLHGLGLLLGRTLDARKLWLRATGASVTAAGLWMLSA